MDDTARETAREHAQRGRVEAVPDPTGVPGLDQILDGGLPRGSLVLIMGLPGSGKTMLASQIAFTAARAGKTVLVLTALSEPTDKLIAHLRSFTFFDPDLIGGPVQFLSMRSALAEGLIAAREAILAEARRIKAQVVMVDGFRGMRSVDTNPEAAREFLYALGTALGALGTTILVTSETDPRDPTFFPETTTADVILGLHYQLLGVRQLRGIEVVKARQSAPMPGLHALALSAAGAAVFPQLEERIARAVLGGDAQAQGAARTTPEMPAPEDPLRRAAFGLPELDAMLRGGLPAATCTLLAGGLGTGKTLLALTFALAGVRADERVVFLGFRESRAQLVQATAPFAFGADLARALCPGGPLTFLEVPPIKVQPDVLADRLLAELDRTKAARLVIDSVAELERGILRSGDPRRLEDFLAALLLALRSRQVTGLLIEETDESLAGVLDLSADALSVLAENVLLLQHLPAAGQMHRVLSVLKTRFSGHDTTLREFCIHAPGGIQVLTADESAAGVLASVSVNLEQAMFAGRRRGTSAGVNARKEGRP